MEFCEKTERITRSGEPIHTHTQCYYWCRTGALAVELVLARLAVLLPVTQPLAGDAEVVVATELVGRAVAHTVFL